MHADPAIRPLPPDVIRLRWLAVDAADADRLRNWRGLLDEEERARADRFVFDSDRATFIAAHALTRLMLTEATGRPPADWRFVRRPFGKPALAPECDPGGLCFSLSHTRGFVACAVAASEIGMDVEASDRRTQFRVADRFFAPEEARLVAAAPEERKRALFFRFWTLKEAFIKATGEGLRRPLDSFAFTPDDPPRISFHPDRDAPGRQDDPRAWWFRMVQPLETRPIALAMRVGSQREPSLEAGAAGPLPPSPSRTGRG